MSLNKRKILSPNSSFERQVELRKLFTNFVDLSKEDCEVLKACITEVSEEIGLIGCLLKEDNHLNNARLLIASLERHNNQLNDRATKLLSRTKEEIDTLIKELANRFLIDTDELSEYENKVYFILFSILEDIKERESFM